MPPRRPDKGQRIRVALTGATGFSGAFILPQLLAAGHDVTALARKPEVLAEKCKTVVKGDLGDEAALAALCAGADVVLHVAGAISAPNARGYFETNLEGTKRLLKAARTAHVPRFVYVSSLAAREPALTHYGASKKAAEDYLLPMDDEDFDVLVVRPPGIYGPGDRGTLPIFEALQSRTAWLPGTAKARFSLIHVSDFAKVMCESVDATAHGVFELDDQSIGGHSWHDLVTAARAITGLPRSVRHIPKALARSAAHGMTLMSKVSGKAPLADAQKIALIYHPDWVAKGWIWPIGQPVSLQDGMKQTYEWYWANGWLKRPPASARAAS